MSVPPRLVHIFGEAFKPLPTKGTRRIDLSMKSSRVVEEQKEPREKRLGFPIPEKTLASYFLTLVIVGQALDAITTQIGLRLGLAESAPDAVLILKAFGPIGLVVEKTAIVVFFILARRIILRNWDRFTPSAALIGVIGFGLFGVVSLLPGIMNAVWILVYLIIRL
jgi:hypothetical protein